MGTAGTGRAPPPPAGERCLFAPGSLGEGTRRRGVEIGVRERVGACAARVRVEGEELVIVPAPQRDYWSKTFYSPLLVKHDAQTLLTVVPATVEATLTTAFTLTPVAQFDQAGIMILVDDTTWVKAGIGEQLRMPASPYLPVVRKFTERGSQSTRRLATIVKETASE